MIFGPWIKTSATGSKIIFPLSKTNYNLAGLAKRYRYVSLMIHLRLDNVIFKPSKLKLIRGVNLPYFGDSSTTMRPKASDGLTNFPFNS